MLLAPVATMAQDGTSFQIALQRAGLSPYWEADVPVPADDEILAGHLVDDALYLYTNSGVVFSIQAETGLIRWAEKLSERNFAVLKPAHIQRTGDVQLAALMTTADTFIIDRYSGRIRKRFSTDFPIGGPPVGVGGALIVGSADGRLRAILWDTTDCTSAQTWWTVRAGGPITTQPVLFAGDRVIAASYGGQVLSCFAGDKAYIWGFRTGGAVQGDPFLYNGYVYVASADRSLYKFDARDGRLDWQHRTGSPLTDGPVVLDNLVYQYVSQDGLVAIDADSGAEIRRFPKATSFVASMGDRVALWNGRDEIELVDRDPGSTTAKLPTGNAKVIQNLQHDAIYVIGTRGKTLCIRAEDAPYLHPSEVASARARLNQAPHTNRADDAEQVTEAVDDTLRRDPLRSRRDRTRGNANR